MILYENFVAFLLLKLTIQHCYCIWIWRYMDEIQKFSSYFRVYKIQKYNPEKDGDEQLSYCFDKKK